MMTRYLHRAYFNHSSPSDTFYKANKDITKIIIMNGAGRHQYDKASVTSTPMLIPPRLDGLV